MTSRSRHSLLAAFVLFCALPLAAANWTEPTAQLAREIAGIAGPGNAALTVRNVSSLSADDVAQIRRALEAQLHAAGVRIVDANTAASELALTLSENVQGYLWIVAIRQSNETHIVMQAVPRPAAVVAPAARGGVSIVKTLLWSQPEPMLDAVVVDASTPNARLLVLEPTRVAVYKLTGGRWEPEQSLPIPHAKPWPRDLRGRLVPTRTHLFDAYLPGVVCTAALTAPLSMNCRESDDPWPLGDQRAFFGAARNFFTGVLTTSAGKQVNVGAFYSAATLERPNYTLWLLAGVDGAIHQYDGLSERPVESARGWGSDIAAVKSTCGAAESQAAAPVATLVLATAAGDSTVPDTLRAYEVADREPVEASAPIQFPGPVTALWSAADGATVAIAHNLKTRHYEAFTISLSCR